MGSIKIEHGEEIVVIKDGSGATLLRLEPEEAIALAYEILDSTEKSLRGQRRE